MPRFSRFAAASFPAALVLALAVPLSAHAGHAANSSAHHSARQASTVFTFGVRGGNIRPWSVQLASDGSVTASIVTVGDAHLPDGHNTIIGLKVLAKAEQFGAMSRQTNCTGTLPDIASRYITYKGKTVAVHGACVSHFNQLYAVLYNTADVQS